MTPPPETPDDASPLPPVQWFPPAETLRRARPLPPLHEMVIDATPEEWAAFEGALADV